MSSARVVVGVGLSSAATVHEVRRLVASTLERHHLDWPPTVVATRDRFVGDPRLAWGCEVIGFSDEELIAASTPVDRAIGIPARVAETAAMLAAGPGAELLGQVQRSAHATVAVAVPADLPASGEHDADRSDVPGVDARLVPGPGPHGGDLWKVAASLGVDPDRIIDLSASLNPFAPDVASLLVDLVRARPQLVTHYPDDRDATLALARALGEDPDRVVLTNGGAEAIALVAAIESEGEVTHPEFSLYERHLDRIRPGAPRWRSNPSNPLGRLARPDEHAHVWDEAFYPLATGRWTRGDEHSWRLGSLTKLWACPGVRLGYVIAPTPHVAKTLRDRQPRWSVSGLAAAAVPRLLDHTDLEEWRNQIASTRDELADELGRIGFIVEATDANWLLVWRPGLRRDLLLGADPPVLVRDCTSFGLTDVHRVAIPRPHQIEAVLAAFTRVGP